MELNVYQVDAFHRQTLRGNPAAVIPLDNWLADDLMQAIAAEHNLSETVFFVPQADGEYAIRWFTPEVEVDLCGHATLASGHVLLNILKPELNQVIFNSQSGALVVNRNGDKLSLDFPSRPPKTDDSADLLIKLEEALNIKPLAILRSRDLVVVLENAEQVSNLKPDFTKLAALPEFGFSVTAPGEADIDFVNRFFAPRQGINEDPVTGSSYCSLIPYWAQRLNKKSLRARQVSKRSGDVWLEDKGERVTIAGYCSLYMQGQIYLP
ncbi:MAG: PhzF family phenazine biosynthesis protein [Oceanospirillaceae bacterium]|nr:PhzF family phenazine biosynthesis protein [Oceanospirillaceae bacterium]MCP5335577.1 PhzF family phenazine biosynthesis protein [Oceanospirillaceae bacterium]MCP5350209.1 PhzF family phenazine biosynthesis protein [Oceanospirillaceae bacterium]